MAPKKVAAPAADKKVEQLKAEKPKGKKAAKPVVEEVAEDVEIDEPESDADEPEVRVDVAAADDDDNDNEKKSRVVNGCVSIQIVKQMMDKLPDEVPSNMSQKAIKAICDTFVKTVIENVKSGNNVTLTNYMTFKRALREERTHKVPKSDKVVTKPEHYVMCIDVKPALKTQFADVEITEKDRMAKKSKE